MIFSIKQFKIQSALTFLNLVHLQPEGMFLIGHKRSVK